MEGGRRDRGKSIPIITGVLIGIIVGILLWFGLGLDGKPFALDNYLTKNPDNTVLQLDSEAPGFNLPSLTGKEIHLKDYRGKVVIINFWATWCAPCRLEMPLLQAVYDKYYPNLTVLAINVGETESVVQDFREEHQLTFNLLLDHERSLERHYQLRGYPTTLLLDEMGTLKVVHLGLLTESQLQDYLVQVGIEN